MSSFAQPVEGRFERFSSIHSASTSGGHDDELVLAGNFEILSRLGEGASGEVHKVRHRPTG